MKLVIICTMNIDQIEHREISDEDLSTIMQDYRRWRYCNSLCTFGVKPDETHFKECTPIVTREGS